MALENIIYLQAEAPSSLDTVVGETRILTQTNAANAGDGGSDPFGLRPGYSGEGYLDFGSSGTGDEAVTYAVTVPEAGTYDLHIRYASAGTRTVQLDDGTSQQTVSFPPTGATGQKAFDNWKVVTVQVALAEGDNTLELALFGGNGPNVDALALSNPDDVPDFAPRFTTAGAFAVAEGETAVGTVGALDVDEDTTDADGSVDPVTYSIVDTADGSAFTIDPDSGALLLTAPADFETQESYELVVAAIDAGGNATELAVAVTVIDDPADNPQGGARLTVNAGSNSLKSASTFSSGTMVFENTGAKAISSVTIHLSNALFTNANSAMVFDPAGGAGDDAFKAFSADGGIAGSRVTSTPSNGNDDDGYTSLTLSFDSALAPNESLTFSIDIDPDSIQGATGSGDAGSVSGLELTGSTVEVAYVDATTAASTLFADGSLAGAVATISDTEPPAPSLSLGGVSGDVTVGGASQTVTVTGPANATVTVLIAEGGLGNGVTDQTAFDANTATGVSYATVTLDGAGQGAFAVTVTDGTPLYMAAAVQGDGAGEFGAVSAPLALALVDPAQPTPAWSFISVPDMFNADYADISGGLDPAIAAVFDGNGVPYTEGLIGAPGWQPGDANSMNVALAQVWKTNTELMVQAAGGNPDLVAIAGDLIYARFTQHIATTEALFDKDGDGDFAQTLNDAGAAYYSWMRKLWEEAGVDTVVAAIGDHEIGDNNWPSGPRTNFVPAMKEAFGEHMVDPIGLAPTWNGVTAFAPEGDGQYDEGSYVYQNKNVLFLTVDVFKFSDTGGLANGGVEASVDGVHLQWINDILDAAEIDASVDHVIVQGHVPVLTPVNSIRSSQMTFEGGENSPFWQALQEHGTNAGGKVRAYFNGEVHATTVIEDASSGIVQISHGATNQADGAAQLDPYFITFEVTPTRITGKEFTIVNDNNDTSDTVWEAHRTSSQTVDTVGAMTEIGTIEIDIATGTTSVATTGNLAAPLRTEGHQTYVGGPGDDFHQGGIEGAGFTQNNSMYGRGGNDELLGRGGNDKLFGEADDDILDGGTGSDELTGGPGNDTYRFAIGDGNDEIKDFVKGEDTIEIGVAAFADLTITPSGNDALVTYQGGQIRVENTDANTLDASDFGFAGAVDNPDPVYVDNIVLNTPGTLPPEGVRDMGVGVQPWADRTHELTSFPNELANGRLIVTNNDDKDFDAAQTYVSFTAIADAFLYLAIDERVPTPSWVDALWTKLDTQITAQNSDGSALAPFDVWGRAMTDGESVSIGGNGTGGGVNSLFLIADDTQLFTPEDIPMLNAPIILQAENADLFDNNPGNGFNDSQQLTQDLIATQEDVSGGEVNDVFDLRPGYSGTGYTDFGSTGDALTFTFDSTVTETTTVDLHIRYASRDSGGARTANLVLNGSAPEALPFPQPAGSANSEESFDTWQVLTTTVTLVPGTNTLSLTLTGSGPNVDAIAFTKIGDAADFGPAFTTLPTFEVADGETVIGTVGAADVDDDYTDGTNTAGTVSFAVTGGANQADLDIDENTGVLSFASGTDPVANTSYEAEITVTDDAGNEVTQAVTVAVTEAPFETIFIQGEDLTILNADAVIGTTSASLARTRTSNQEQVGLNQGNDTPYNGVVNGVEEFDVYGLRPGYSGEGYLDINGSNDSSTGPAKAEFSFDAPAGTYDITMRVASNTDRPLNLVVDGVQTDDVIANSGEFFIWTTITFTVDVAGDGPHSVTINQVNATSAPNIDAIAISAAGAPVTFPAATPLYRDPTALEGTGETPEDTAVTIDIADLIGDPDQVDEPTISAATSPHGTVDIDGTELTFTPTGDFNGPTTISYTVTDREGATADGEIAVTVDPVNDAPTVSGTLDGVTVTAAEGTTIDLSGIEVADIDNDAGEVTLGVRLAVGGAAPDGVSVTGTTLTIPDGLEPGDLALEIFANDGELDSDSVVSLTVTVEEAVTAEPFETIILQAEDGTPGATNSGGTLVRDAENPETGSGFSGLRPDFGGTGYIDYGDTAGDSYTYSFNDDAGGARVLHVRYATNGNRPLDVLVNGTSVLGGTTPFTDTDPDGGGDIEGFDAWDVLTFDITTVAGANNVTLEIPVPGANAPNIDAIAISDVGATVDFPIADISADADGDLAATPLAYTVGLADADSVEFTLSGIDEDVTGLEVSTDGGTTFAAATLGAVTDGVAQVTVDLSAITDVGSSEVVFRVTDGAANTATTSVPLDFVAETVVAEIEAETFSVTDANDDTAPASNQPGFTGTGFMDMGLDVGDTVSFDVTVAEAGTYTLLFRYASSTDRPMTLEVDGGDAPVTLPFVSTDPDGPGGVDGFTVWETQSIEVELGAGSNTIALANVNATGPNIDRVTILREVAVVDTPPTAEDGTEAGLEDATSIVVDIADLIADAEDGEPTVISAAVDPAAGTVSVDGTVLTFIPAPNFNGDADITYTVEDSASQSASGTVTVTVDPVNDAPEVTGTLDGVTVTDAEGTSVDLSGLGVADVDNVAGEVTLGVRLAGGGAAPDGVSVTGTTLTIPAGLELGDLALEIFANDGELDSDPVVPLTVTVEEAPDLAYVVPADGDLVVQLENRDGSIVINDTDIPDEGGINNADLTQFRDSSNPELNGDGTVQEGGGKTGGLWDGKTGEGYLDMGGQVGDQVTFDVTVEAAGDYTFVFRYINGSDFNEGPSNDGNGIRPMDIAVNGTIQATPDFERGFNDAGELNSWTDWQDETVTLSLPAGTSTISLTNTVENGPNLDQVTISPPPNAAPVAEDAAAASTTAEDTPVVIDVADLVSDDRDADADLTVTAEATNGTVSVDGTELTFTPDADYNGPATITFRAEDTDGALSDDATIAVDVTPVDDPATAITLTARPVAENAAGAVVADVVITDPDSVYGAADLEIAGDTDDLFELAEEDGNIVLKLQEGKSLDFEAVSQPSVTVTLDGLESAPFEPNVTDVQEAVDVTFDVSTIQSYTSDQDRPEDGGAGASVGEDGTTLTLDGNLWKRVPLDTGYTITENSRLQVTIEIGSIVPEIIAIGFDDDESAFENDKTVYQIGGPQTQNNFADLRGQGTDNGDGTFTFTIDLSAQAGTTPGSMIFISDDDAGSLGSVTYSAVSLFEATDEAGGNTPPREVGGGVADLSVPEGAAIEVDFPFVDDDGDALTYGFAITDAGGNAVNVEGLSLIGSVLSGSAPENPGGYTVTLTADDDGDGPNTPVESSFQLTVTNVNDAPVSDDPALEPYFFRAGEPIPDLDLAGFEDFFSDPDGDQLEITAEGLPPGLTVNEEGAIEGTPTVGGDFTVTIRATDPSGASATLEILLQIEGGQLGDVTVIEAEDFTGLAAAEGFIASGQVGASENQILRVSSAWTDATVSTDLSQNGLIEGWYQVAMTRYDETDGSAIYSLQVGDTVLADNAAFDGIPDVETANDTFDNNAARGIGGEAGNLKTIVYDTPVFVSAGTILTLSGRSSGELLRTDKFTFTRVEEPNEAPGAAILSADTVAENADGAVIGDLSAVDPDGDDAAIVFSVDDASPFEVLGNTLRLKVGEAFDFETTPSVDVVVAATDANGASTDTTLTVTVTDVNEPVGAPALTAGAVAENGDGATIGTLSAVDPEGGAVTFTVPAESPFEVVNGNELKLKDGETLNFEVTPTVTVAVTADDGTGPVTGDVTFDVTDVNDAPTLADPAALADLNVANGAGASVDLSVLGAADEDADDTPTYAIASATETPLLAGFEIDTDGVTLLVPTDAPAGAYEIEVFATDGELDSESVFFTVTVGDPAPFEPITIQAEDEVLAELIVLEVGSNTTVTTIRDPGNPESNQSLENGLRPDFTGTGYLDFGDTPGDAIVFTVNVPVGGNYDLNIRYASQGDPRPLDLSVNGTAQGALDFTDTDPDGQGGVEGFDNWEFLTQTVALTPGDNTITLAIPAGASTGPNIDRIEITEAGTGPIPPADLAADEDGNLAAAPENATVAVADLATVEIRLTGVDADIVGYEVSLDGGTTFVDATPVADGADQVLTVDLTGTAAGATVDVQVRLTDDADNQVTTTASVDVEDEVVTVDPVTIQAEDETLVTVTDVGGTAQGEEIREVNAAAPDDFGNFRVGAVDDAYIDFGANPGDAMSVAFDAPVAGTYEVTIRYANGSDEVRPLDLTVNGGTPSQIAFVQTVAPTTQLSGWEGWTDLTVSVNLQAGANTLVLAIPATADGGVDNGPNIDQLTFTYVDPGVDDSADEDGNLDVSAAASVALADSDTVDFTLTGVDADIVTFEASIDGGAFTEVTPVGGVVSLDLSTFGAGATVDVVFRLTDDDANTVEQTASVAIVADPVEEFDLTLQLENRDGSIVIDDDTIGTDPAGEGNPLATQFRDLDNIEGIQPGREDGLWDGYTGTGYMDMGGNIGDAFEFDVDVPEAGTYSFTFRYVNADGDGLARPMLLSVDGTDAVTIPFTTTGTGAPGWTNWTDVTVEVDLAAGQNTIRMENTIANGPNLDSVNIFREGDVVDPGSEPGPRDTIRINFQDGAVPKADGYLVDNFDDFGDRGNGLSYGWATEASLLDADGSSNTPAGSDYPEIAINERTTAGVDPRLLGYAHFDLGSYPGDQDDPNFRLGWEIALDNGWYEVTVAVGDTGGPNDSDNRLFIEGELATAWSATDLFKSQLVTTLANVQDGHLTLSAQGGNITEMQYLEIRELSDLTPGDGNEAPVDYPSFANARAVSGVGATEETTDLDPGDGVRPEGIDPSADIFLDVNVVDGRGGVLLESLDNGSVRLFETLTGEQVTIGTNTTGGFDSLTISPVGNLKENTSYTLVIDGFEDRGPIADDTAPTREFQKFSTSFVTGEAAEVVDRDVAFVDTVQLDGSDGAGGFTSIEVSPDQTKLYVVTITGQIKRWDLNPDGTVDKASEETFTPGGAFTAENRGFIGLVFDPEDPNTIWVTDNAQIPLSGRDNGVPDFSGAISKVELGTGGSLENASMSTYITGLPRSNGDHVTNSLEFRANPDAGVDGAPNFLMYLIQGSNSAMGEADSAWGFRPERLLNAAVMEIDHTRDAPPGGFDVSTEPLPNDGNNRRFADNDGDLKNGGILISNAQDAALNGKYLHFAENGVATVREGADAGSALFREYYDPFAEDAVLNIFATGQRNAYDLVWHSNGFLYVPTNGSAGGGVSPDNPDTGVNEETSHPTQVDYLFRVVEDGYYGHPNPVRNEFILNGGNPTNGADPNETGGNGSGNQPGYNVGINPDPNYDLEGSYSLGTNRSPNGATEYTNNIFGNSLQGALLFTEYSGGNDVRVVLLGADGTPVQDFVLQDPDGQTITYADPLDIVEGANGQLYLMTLNRGTGESEVVLLNPAPGGVVGDNTADEGNNLTLTVVDASDPAAVVFLVSGLDDDIETLEINVGTTTQQVAPNGQNQFTIDLSGETGPVTATLTVQDEVPNTATASVTFTPGETPEPQGFYDGVDFTNLDPDNTIIRVANDPDTADGGAFDSDGDGLNDGADGNSYVDFGGGAGDKVSLDVTVTTAGLYDIVLRMANGNATQLRPIDVKLGDQVVSITDTNTGAFTTWVDFPIQLNLEAGLNTIVFEQVNADGGPNIDSATVTLNTPTGVPNDGTEQVGGQTFVIYEAENAQLDGPVVVDEDRTQSGDFVDFDGTGDQSVTWTVSVAEDGDYAVDILYALATTKAARPMTLSVDGTPVLTLPFEPNSNADETEWNPQSTGLTLTAGTHTITVTAPDANGPNLDYLRISQSPLTDPLDLTADEGNDLSLTVIDQTDASAVVLEIAGLDDDIDTAEISFNGGAPITVAAENGQVTVDTGIVFGTIDAVLTVTDDANNTATAETDFAVAPDGNPNADIEIESLDPAFYSDRLHFSFLQNPANAEGDREFKDTAFVRISNSGTEALEIFSVDISGPFALPEPTLDALIDGLTIDAGASIDIEVLFDADAINPKPGSGQNGVQEGALTFTTNDAEDPIVTVDLAGFWQSQDEAGQEPNVNEVWQVFGFGNVIPGLSFIGGGENSVLNFDDYYIPAPGAESFEVLSPYWRIADGVTEVTATLMAAFHGPGGAGLGIHAPGNKGADIGLTSHAGDNNQSILPLQNNGSFATATFTNATIPDAWAGNDVFGIEMVNLSTDPTLNTSGNETPTQAELDAAYGVGTYSINGEILTDADGNEISDGYTVRMFQALDADGVAIENVFLGLMDYTGINYDYNDNMFIFEGITPVGNGGTLSISGLDDAAADDRLVFTNIDNPNNGGDFGGQAFRNEAVITLTNDGIGALNISGFSLSGVDLADFQVSGTTGSLAAGASTTVTITFIGSDPADDGAAELRNATLTVQSDGFSGDQVIQLVGLAQLQSEGGEEPSVAQIVEAFGYSTDVAQGQLNSGGTVETVGDEVLLPYLQRLDGSQPIEVINLAAFLQQGDISRLNLHELESGSLTELFAGDDNQGQTVLPDGLVTGPGDSGSVGRASIDRDEPFGLKVTVDGKTTFAAWTDPEANKEDPALGVDDGGHYIRFFEAKDAAGNVIEGTYIGIQDYPGGGNFDYNDAMFLVKNVQAYDLTAADDGNGDGINDALQDDDDNDGTVNFFDDDFTPPPGPQSAFNGTQTPWAVDGDGLTLMANLFDTGGQGVAYNDTTPASLGDTSVRPGEAVDISVGTGAIGFTVGGEWVEYTIDVAQAGDYQLVFNASSPIDGRLLTATFAAGGVVYETATADVPDTGAYTTYADTDAVTVTLQAGEQVLRVNFDNDQQDLMSFTLTPEDPPEPVQAPFPGPDAPVLNQTLTVEAENFDAGGQGISWNDNPGREGGSPFRGDTDVELVGAENDIGYILAGEWVEYTIDVAQAGTYALSLNAKSPIAGNSIAVSVEDGPALATFALPDANGAGDNGFGGTSFAETGAQFVTLEAGEQTLRFTFDGAPATNGYVLDFRSFTLTEQEPVDVNEAPTTTGIAPETGTEGESFTLDVSDAFGDPDGDTLTFTASGLPDGLSINGSGVISGTLPEVAADTDFTVTVTASDGQLTEDADFILSVDDVPDPVDPDQTPFPGPAPEFDNGVLTVDASNYDDGGQGVAYNDTPGLSGGGVDGGRDGSDVEQTGLGDIGWIDEGEWLEYTIVVPQDGVYDLDLLLANNGGGGRTATVAFYEPGADTPYASTDPIANPVTGGWTTFVPRTQDGISLQAGTQVVRVTFNGGSQDFRNFTLTQQAPVDTNEAPVLTGTSVTVPGATVGDAFSLDVSSAFSDPDGDTLSYELSGAPAGLSISSGGVISGTPGSNGDFTLVVTASDGEFEVDTTFALTVGADNQAPVANGIGDVSQNEATVFTLDAAGFFTDPDGDTLSYAASGLPTGLTIDPTKGEITGTLPEVAADTIFDVTVTASDDGFSTQSDFDLTVTDVPDAPNVIGEAGTVTFAQPNGSTWFSVQFSETLENPSVVMGPISFNGGHPGNMRVRDVTNDGFEFQLDEWDYLDGGHVSETVSWMAVEQGVHQLANGQVIAAGVGSASGAQSEIDFGTSFAGGAAVMGQVSSTNQSAAVVERISNVDATGFDVILDREEGASAAHGNEAFAWIATALGGSAGDGFLSGVTPNAVTHQPFAIDFDDAFGSDGFAFFADLQSADGGDTSVVRLAGPLSSGGTSVFLEEEISSDFEVEHTTEVVGYTALEFGLIFGDNIA